MSAVAGLRVAVAGATGLLGGELLVALEESRFPIDELVPIGSQDSAGGVVELAGEPFDVLSVGAPLRGVDLMLLCTPPEPSLELARRALHAAVPVLDLSGTFAATPEVPLVIADLEPAGEALRAPLVAAPTAPGLALALVLAPIARALGVVRAVATLLSSASTAGRAGVETLSSESIALFNQQELPELSAFAHPVAFDCVPGHGADEGAGETASERALESALHRLLGADLRLAITMLRVPTFAGDGATLALETRSEASVETLKSLLAKAPGLELDESGDPRAPSTRAATGRDVVLVGRVRRDPSSERGALLWIAADGVRLAAAHGARLAHAWLAARRAGAGA